MKRPIIGIGALPQDRHRLIGRRLRDCASCCGLLALVFAAVLLATDAANAQEPRVELEVVPTELEWAQYPPYCRARYSISGYAGGTRWERSVPQGEMRYWERRMGNVWPSLHHYCFGLIQLARARLISSEYQRNYLYRRAIAEFLFTYRNIANSGGSPFAAQVAVNVALGHQALGEMEEAKRYLDEAERHDPTLPSVYSARAILLRDEGNLERAAEVLVAGLEAVTEESAELHYILGLTYVDLGKTKQAREHAERAYQLGYPLPGLRNRLRQSGGAE